MRRAPTLAASPITRGLLRCLPLSRAFRSRPFTRLAIRLRSRGVNKGQWCEIPRLFTLAAGNESPSVWMCINHRIDTHARPV